MMFPFLEKGWSSIGNIVPSGLAISSYLNWKLMRPLGEIKNFLFAGRSPNYFKTSELSSFLGGRRCGG
jgi:hypothetical protein